MCNEIVLLDFRDSASAVSSECVAFIILFFLLVVVSYSLVYFQQICFKVILGVKLLR